ncbi:hypothetical protein [Bradyrhizobium ontarionense]|nr:hypothetical protein [Bradyrhizobium sp. A19]
MIVNEDVAKTSLTQLIAQVFGVGLVLRTMTYENNRHVTAPKQL